ncbi:MAG: hypothetical protein KatS3mg114_1278 [Planctomycetaceae bacterium]|nr:MAG: hypothetical protein KatS3mg114_1278 [Planctomycetaceae bacterium]
MGLRCGIMDRRQWLAASFGLLQAATATLFLRPAELWPALEGLPLFEGLTALALLLASPTLVQHFSPAMLCLQPISLCALGMLPAVIISHVQHGYLSGAWESAQAMAKPLLFYGLVITTVNTPSRLRAFLLNVAVCTSTMVTLCLLDYYHVVELEFLEHLHDVDGEDDEGLPLLVYRLRGTGIFHDPNDLAMVITAGGVLAWTFLQDCQLGLWRWGWLLPLIVEATALLETKSRGGLLAACLAGLMLACFRYGMKLAVPLAVVSVLTLPVVAGRAARISLSSGSTGHERIEMWREGYDALKSLDLLFGVGHNMFADFAGLVAHNSFVHCYVELGIVGGSIFFGAWYFAAVQLWRLGRLRPPVWHAGLQQLRPTIAALLTGWCGSMLSLSRAYVVPTWLVLGTAVAYLNLCWIHTPAVRPLCVWEPHHLWKWGGASFATFVGFYIITRIAA